MTNDTIKILRILKHETIKYNIDETVIEPLYEVFWIDELGDVQSRELLQLIRDSKKLQKCQMLLARICKYNYEKKIKIANLENELRKINE